MNDQAGENCSIRILFLCTFVLKCALPKYKILLTMLRPRKKPIYIVFCIGESIRLYTMPLCICNVISACLCTILWFIPIPICIPSKHAVLSRTLPLILSLSIPFFLFLFLFLSSFLFAQSKHSNVISSSCIMY